MSIIIGCTNLGFSELGDVIKDQRLTSQGITLTDSEWITLTKGEKAVLNTLKAKGKVSFSKGGVALSTAGEIAADTDVASTTTITVATAGDWTAEPSNVKAALDELADRIKTLEDA